MWDVGCWLLPPPPKGEKSSVVLGCQLLVVGCWLKDSIPLLGIKFSHAMTNTQVKQHKNGHQRPNEDFLIMALGLKTQLESILDYLNQLKLSNHEFITVSNRYHFINRLGCRSFHLQRHRPDPYSFSIGSSSCYFPIDWRQVILILDIFLCGQTPLCQ